MAARSSPSTTGSRATRPPGPSGSTRWTTFWKTSNRSRPMPATTGSAVLTLPSDTEILMVREFDAPPDLVFGAYTTPEHVKRWWAGQRGNVTGAEIDLRVGG